ncbi:hypothetical protein [Segeticoccus rhizosphaerae]|uniref:hypothetical protein n=1 Tax=Segeticoccus rhizosphaerae TaxID=1104777 RepID=UPI0010C0F6AB|nr:hypothetical protein [Ornithinicoccus soli]
MYTNPYLAQAYIDPRMVERRRTARPRRPQRTRRPEHVGRLTRLAHPFSWRVATQRSSSTCTPCPTC